VLLSGIADRGPSRGAVEINDLVSAVSSALNGCVWTTKPV